jgi:putative ABC transport system permease protein
LLLSYALWQKQFAARQDVLGKTVVLDGAPLTIVGVMPKDFAFPLSQQAEIWAPITLDLRAAGASGITTQRGGHYLDAIGLLQPNVGLSAAQVDADLVMSRLAQQYPDSNRNKSILLESEKDAVVGGRRSQLVMLSVGVLCVFLIACLNVATLILARAARKEKETAVCVALGASFRRILQQVLAQCVWLVLLGTGFGIALAIMLIASFTRAWGDAGMKITLHGEVLLFITGACCFCVLLCGCGPALLMARIKDLSKGLKATRSSTGSKRAKQVRRAFIIGQTALAMILLVQAGLLFRSVLALTRVDAGFNPDHVFTFQLQFPEAKYSDAQRNATLQRVMENLRSLPGVTKVAVTRSLPLSGEDMATGFRVQGMGADKRLPIADLMMIGSDYFDALGIRLLQGRAIDRRDEQPGAPPVAVVNETLAKRFFGGENPIGRTIQPLIRAGDAPPAVREIIGVVHEVKSRGLNAKPGNQIYVPYTQFSVDTASIALLTTAGESEMSDAVRLRVRQADPTLPVYNVASMEKYLELSTAQLRYNAAVLLVFGLMALALTTVGLYGVIAYSVTQRSREFGIRMALGAQVGRVLFIVLKEGIFLVTTSIVLGLIGALAVARLASSILFGITPHDPVTFGIVITVITLVALLATYTPARRAVRIDLVDTLRVE